MSKQKYSNRLEKLFSSVAILTPEPDIIPASALVRQPTESSEPRVSAHFERASALMLEITRRTGEAQSLDGLLTSTMELIRDRFNLYSAQVYQVAPSGKELLLQGDVRGIPIDLNSSAGQVALNRKPFLIEDVSSVEDFLKDPELPDTCSVLYLPMMFHKQLFGILELHSSTPGEITREAIPAFERIGEQLAAAIENVRKMMDLDQERTHSELVSEKLEKSDWGDFLDGIHHAEQIGFAYDQNKIRSLKRDDFSESDNASGIKKAIKIGRETIGSIQLLDAGERQWKREEVELIQVVAQRLSQQIDSLRLLEQSQRYQQEAEDAFHRLSRENWDRYLQDYTGAEVGFTYDLNQVTSLKGDQISKNLEAATLELKVRDHSIGNLVIDTPHKMDTSTQAWVNTITERLSAHLDALRLTEQREQALAESELLYEISADLSAADSLQGMLDAMAKPAIAAKADHTQLFFIEEDEIGHPIGLKLIAAWANEGTKRPIPIGFRFNLADMPSYQIWLDDPSIPLISSNIAQEDRLDDHTKAVFARDKIKSGALLPLAIGQKWIGIALFNWTKPHVFSEVENRLYKALSRQAAVVMNNLLLLEQTQRRAREMETVARVSTAASSSLSPGELLQSVVDLTKENFDLYHTQVYLVDDRGVTLSIGAGTGEVGRKMIEEGQLIRIRQGKSVVAQAARRREYIIVKDVKEDQAYIPHPLLPDTRSQLVIPMIAGDLLLGVFDVQSVEPNRFTEADVRIFSTQAAQVAVALQNANLYVEQAATVERLRELDHLKSDFLANMSHELRTPLNSILGFTDVMLLGIDGTPTEQMENDLKLIEKNGNHLLSLINDVLDMAKIESGRMQLGIEEFELHEVLEEASDIASSLAREKGVSLDMVVDSDHPITISADRVRLRQVLINLLGNAVKFTEKGGVTVRAGMREGWVRIEVKDTGIGIPHDKLEMIFESFSQVDTSTTRKVGGTGLGLPISRSLVELHGGRLWAESSGISGKGSTFIIEVPLKAVDRTDNRL